MHGRASEVVRSISAEGERPTARRRQRLTQSQEDYLKALYDLGGATGSVSTLPLARRLQVSAASATEMLGKLDALGVVRHNRYRGAILTAGGAAAAFDMVRHHRAAGDLTGREAWLQVGRGSRGSRAA